MVPCDSTFKIQKETCFTASLCGLSPPASHLKAAAASSQVVLCPYRSPSDPGKTCRTMSLISHLMHGKDRVPTGTHKGLQEPLQHPSAFCSCERSCCPCPLHCILTGLQLPQACQKSPASGPLNFPSHFFEVLCLIW